MHYTFFACTTPSMVLWQMSGPGWDICHEAGEGQRRLLGHPRTATRYQHIYLC